MTEQTSPSSERHIQVQTGGGAFVDGSVMTGGGKFVGRDEIVNYITNHIVQPALSAVEEAEKSRSLAQQRLAEGVHEYAQRLIAIVKSDTESDKRNVYKGLVAYRIGDAEIFFGREQEILAVQSKLQNDSLTILHAESGAGKTSLLQAGLSPYLISEGHLPIYIRPYDISPSLAIKRTFLPDLEKGSEPEQVGLQKLEQAPLKSFLRQVTSVLGFHSTLYILLDQFEESFTLVSKEEQRKFIRELADCLKDEALLVRWVLALRSEFFSEIATFRPEIKNPFANEYRLNRLTPEEAKLVITAPAERNHVQFEAALVDTLLKELQDEKGDVAPPQLQLVCAALYDQLMEQRQAEPTLPLVISQTIYSAKGQAPGILRGYLNQVLTRQLPTKPERDLARQLLIALVSSDKRRIRRSQGELVGLLAPYLTKELSVAALAEQLVESRLLNVDRDTKTDEPCYELVHDYLLTEIEIDPEVQTQKQAQEMLDREVEDFKGSQGKFLLSLEKYRFIDSISSQSRLFINETAKELLKLSKQYHETEQERQVRLARQRAMIVTVAAVMFVIAVISGVIGIQQWETALVASANKLIEQSLHLASQGLDQLDNDPVASLTLSLQALPLSSAPKPYVPQAEFALTRALRTSLERHYIQAGTAPLTKEQIAVGKTWIAVGSDAMRLVKLDLTQAITLPGQTGQIKQVAWAANGETLLGYDDQNHVFVWPNPQQVISHTFATPIACAHWQPGTAQIVVCHGQVVQLWSYQTDQLTSMTTFPSNTQDAQWSPDGHWLAAWDAPPRQKQQTYILWNGQTGQLVSQTPITYTERVRESTWSSDSLHLVATSISTPTLRIWQVAALSHAKRITLTAKIDGVTFVDPATFVTWGKGDVTRLWSSEGKPLRQYGLADDFVQGVALAPDKTTFLTFLANSSAYLWDIKTAARLAEFRGHDRIILGASWHKTPYGAYLLTHSIDGTIRVWEADVTPTATLHKAVMTLHGHTDGSANRPDVLGMRWQDEQQLLTYGADGSLRLWQVFDEQGTPLCDGVDADNAPICYDFSQAFTLFGTELTFASWVDDQTVLLSDGRGTVRRCSLTACDMRSLNQNLLHPIETVWSPDGQQVFTYTKGLNGQVVDFASGTAIAPVTGPITTAFWLDMGLLVSYAGGGTALLQPNTGATLVKLSDDWAVIAAAQFQKTNKVALADNQGLIHIWDAKEEVASLKDNQPHTALQALHALQWSPDGKRLLAVGSQVTLWDIATRQAIWASNDTGFRAQAALSPDGQWVAVATDNGFAVLDANTGKFDWGGAERQAVMGIQWVRSGRWPNQDSNPWPMSGLIRFMNGEPWQPSASRLLLLTWQDDYSTRLWEQESGTEIMRLPGAGPVDFAAVNPSGSYILTGMLMPNANLERVRFWQTALQTPASWLDLAYTRLTRRAPTSSSQRLSSQPGSTPGAR